MIIRILYISNIYNLLTRQTTSTLVSISQAMTNCSNCNTTGHNKRTCSLVTDITGVVNEKTVKRTYTCSHCNGVGHNARTCGLKYDRSLESGTLPGFTWDWWTAVPSPKKTKKAKQIRQCACCGEIGHNVRTCTLLQPLHSHRTPIQQIGAKFDERKPRMPDTPNRGVQVTQIIDFDIYDEPWVWAPIRPINRPLTLSSSPIVLP